MPTDSSSWGLQGRRGAGVLADVVRAATALSAVLSLVWLSPSSALHFGVLFVVLLGPRAVGIPRPFDAMFCLCLLMATWSSVQDWYLSVSWLDEVVHVVTVGAASAAAYLALARLELMPGPQEEPIRRHRSSVLILSAAFGFGLAAVWEIYEWAANMVTPHEVHTGYVDTIMDMLLGGLGSLVAGITLVVWAHTGHGPGRGLPEDQEQRVDSLDR